jgi:hypothetical protein
MINSRKLSAKADQAHFAQDRTYTTAITSALTALLDMPGQIQDGHVLFLTRH